MSDTLSMEDLNLVDEPDTAAAEAAAAEALAAEEAATAAAATEAAEAAATAEGEKDAWRDTLDEKRKEIATRFNSVGDIIQSNIDLRTQNSQSIRVPADDATDDDVAKFRKAVGVPDEESAYVENFKVPDGVEITEQDQGIIDLLVPAAHKSNISQTAFDGVVGELLKVSHTMGENLVEEIHAEQDRGTAALKKRWGDDYEANTNLAQRIGAKRGESNPDFGAFMESTIGASKLRIGDHPEVVEMLSQIGRLTSEGGMVLTTEERAGAQDELNELNKSVPVGSVGYTDLAHQTKLQALYAKVAGEEPIIGQGDRTV